MNFKVRTFDKRFNDPAFMGDHLRPSPQHMGPLTALAIEGRALRAYDEVVDPRASDGKRTVILHGKRVSERSPRVRWPKAELWGVSRCNVLYWRESLTDWTRWFDLHPSGRTDHHTGIKAKRPEAWDWYTRQDTTRPIYLLEATPEVPASVAFPRAQVQAAFDTRQFTVSVDWILAFALLEGFERIVLNGIGTRQETDYQYAHKGILYWLGFARGRGVEVVVEGPSCYAEPSHVYGYEIAAPSLTGNREHETDVDKEYA